MPRSSILRRERERWALAPAVVGVAAWSRAAHAHTLGLSSGEYRRAGSRIDATFSLARGDLARLVPAVDADRDGHVTALEVERAKAELRTRLVERVAVTAGASCAPSLEDAALADQDGVLVRARYACASVGEATVDVGFLEDLPRTHRHVARVVVGDAVSDRVLTREMHVASVPAAAVPASRPVTIDEAPPSFVGMGFEHVLTGADHVLFLFGLALARPAARRLALLVTAFTLGHCTTLALVALHVVAPHPRVVEPLIAASVVYAGLHPLLRRDTPPSWLLTLAFGLVHGAGFAAALAEHPVTRARPVYATLTFNVGVELAQLAVIAVATPLVMLLGDRRAGSVRLRDVLSALVALAGAVWLVARLVG